MDSPHDPEGTERPQPGSQSHDAEAGPLVRPYAMPGGSTDLGPTGARLDPIILLAGAYEAGEDTAPGPNTGH